MFFSLRLIFNDKVEAMLAHPFLGKPSEVGELHSFEWFNKFTLIQSIPG